MVEKQMLSFDNRKLGKNIANFALPTTVCKIRNICKQGCSEYCYAKKMERIWPNVKTKWRWNFQQSLQKDFVAKMREELSKTKANVVRVHVGGDFYNQEYLDNWMSLAKEFKDKTFYSYTKALDLDFSQRPSNFRVILSDDKLIFPNHHDKFDGVSYIQEIAEKSPSSGKWSLCPADCKSCHICWEAERPLIIFRRH